MTCVCVYLSFSDAVLVATLNCLTSVFAGFVIFSIVGFMANAQGKEVADVIDSGNKYTGACFTRPSEVQVRQQPINECIKP